jgi:hypothetical protein
MEETTNKNPIKVFTCGAVKAAIWADSRVINNTVVEVHSVRIDRSYKDKDNGEWKYTTTFAAEDLPKVALVAMEAYKFIRLRSQEQDRTDELSVDNGPQGASEVLR